MQKLTLYIITLYFFTSGCAPTVSDLAESDPESLIARKSELLKGDNVPIATIQSVVNAHNNLGSRSLKKGDYSAAEAQFKSALGLDIKSKQAKFGLSMIKGHRFYKQGSKTSLWDALEQYGRASYYSPENGEPHYWMGRTYEKKDEGDFELIIEVYEKALSGTLSETLKKDTEKRLAKVKKRKKTYEEFWK